MPKSVQSVNEPEYGAKVGQQRNEDAQASATAIGASMYPEYFAEGDEESVAQNAPVAQPAQQQGYTVRNPAMLIPASMNYPQQQATPVERRYRAGLLWEVLASDPNASEMTRMIARSLLETRS